MTDERTSIFSDEYVSLLEEYDSMESSRCPQCGGTSGYCYRTTVKFVQACSWNGDPQGFDPLGGTESKMAECKGCHTKFRRSTIEKRLGGAQ